MPYSDIFNKPDIDLDGDFFSNIRFQSRLLFGISSSLWMLWSRASGHPLPAPEDVQLVVEGYPRSGNTFAEHMLRIMCPHLTWVSHTHARGTLRWSKEYGIPVLLVFRHPIDAAISLFIYHGRQVSLKNCLARWIIFHRVSLQHPACCFLDFEALTRAPEQTLRAGLCALPGLADYIEAGLPENPAEDFTRTHDRDMAHLKNVMGIHYGDDQSNKPNKRRTEIKERILACPSFKALIPLCTEASDLYQELQTRSQTRHA